MGVPGCLVGGRFVEREVTLQESTAANLEYADFHCWSGLAAAAFCEFGGGVILF